MEEYIPVNIDTLMDTDNLDLYLKTISGKTINFVLFHKGSQKVKSKNKLIKARNDKIEILYIKKKDHQKYLDHLHENLTDILIDRENKPQDQAKIIYNATQNVMHSIFNDPTNPEHLRNSTDIVNTAVSKVLNEEMSPYLVNLAVYDHVKYIHAVNCFVLSLFFAKHKGLNGSDLKAIGTGALLHDIGETQLHPELIKQDRKLTIEERKILEQHPYLGFILMENVTSFSIEPKALFMIWEHHERWDGSGYPKKLEGEQITEFARLLSMVDTYLAMTTVKSYRSAYKPFEALKRMISSRRFNKDELLSFISFLGNSKIKID